MKQIAIKKTLTYYFTDSCTTNSGSLDEKLDEEMRLLLKKYDVHLAESCTGYYGLKKFSICNCESCGNVMINRDRNPTGFGGGDSACDFELAVLDGGDYRGQQLCEECLPNSHRWGLHP
ncbi:MAG: hypothetical protein WGN25_12650 [Candidatus Electrothrix sp. GW3-4]|uniref:hypothetical protein n=1 Tax=Candidatus Electrothrix sp. GW3-4 TaxID=3126740 RepID=UPI0030D0EFD7